MQLKYVISPNHINEPKVGSSSIGRKVVNRSFAKIQNCKYLPNSFNHKTKSESLVGTSVVKGETNMKTEPVDRKAQVSELKIELD